MRKLRRRGVYLPKVLLLVGLGVETRQFDHNICTLILMLNASPEPKVDFRGFKREIVMLNIFQNISYYSQHLRNY